jgi:hypothetical protein
MTARVLRFHFLFLADPKMREAPAIPALSGNRLRWMLTLL